MNVSVVIPTWNGAMEVERVLEALLPLEVDGEVLVVDNGVINQDTEILVARLNAKYSNLRYVGFKKQLGYAGAVNEGVRAAQFRYVAVMNNDNLPGKDWLKSLLAELQNTPNCAITTSLVERAGIPHEEGGLSVFGRIVYTGRSRKPTSQDVFQPDGSAFLLDREKISVPYEDEYFIYQEDAALGWKAHLMGFKVRLVPHSRVVTFDGGSTRRIPYRTAFYTERNRWLNYLVFPERRTVVKCLPLWLLDAVASALKKNLRARIHAWTWILFHLNYVADLRKRMQAERKVSDAAILPKVFGRYLTAVDPFLFFYFRLVGLHLQK